MQLFLTCAWTLTLVSSLCTMEIPVINKDANGKVKKKSGVPSPGIRPPSTRLSQLNYKNIEGSPTNKNSASTSKLKVNSPKPQQNNQKTTEEPNPAALDDSSFDIEIVNESVVGTSDKLLLTACPCNLSDSQSHYVSCTKCTQDWHQNCVNLYGLDGNGIKQLTEWLCPRCYKCSDDLVANPKDIKIKASNATKYIETLEKLGKDLKKSVSSIEMFDSHLKHMLLDDSKLIESNNRLKSINDDVKILLGSNVIQPSQENIKSLNDDIKTLVEQVDDLSNSKRAALSSSEENLTKLKSIHEVVQNLANSDAIQLNQEHIKYLNGDIKTLSEQVDKLSKSKIAVLSSSEENLTHLKSISEDVKKLTGSDATHQNQENIKILNDDVKTLMKLVDNLSDSQRASDSSESLFSEEDNQLRSISEDVKKLLSSCVVQPCQENIISLNDDIKGLMEQVNELSKTTVAASSSEENPSPQLSQLIKQIENLTQQSSNQTAEIEALKTSLKSTPQPTRTEHISHEINIPLSYGHDQKQTITERFCPTQALPNPTKFCDSVEENCLGEDLQKTLKELLTKTKFRQLNGRAVASYGDSYYYNGSPAQRKSPMPSVLKDIIKIVHKEEHGPIPNSCVINRFQGKDSYLPEHSDNEKTIDPESTIHCISIGNDVTLTYKDKISREEKTLVAKNNSIYRMSAKSQLFFTHRIEKSSIMDDNFTRYSITLRAINKNNTNSTIILGDSNVKHIKFGKGRNTFGDMMPGTKKTTYHIHDIKPADCIGYSNAILHVGINDLKDYSKGRTEDDPPPDDIQSHFRNLTRKIEEIQTLTPHTRIHLSPVLPTGISHLNSRAMDLNSMLCDYVNKSNPSIRFFDFWDFLGSDGLLHMDFRCYNNPRDPIHLGREGIIKLVGKFRDSILRPKVDARNYNSVLSSGGVPPPPPE